MRKIGFNWGWGGWGQSKKSSVSKWEKSYFGGFYRLVSDHPRVVIDNNVDFEFATMKYLAYFEKEKICKIFLSKTKNNFLIDTLMKDATTTSEKKLSGEEMITTTINRDSKNLVLYMLMRLDSEKEYHPFFEHYKDFILDTQFSFKKQTDQQNDKNKNGNDESGSDSKNKSQQNQNQQNQNDKDNDKKQNQGQKDQKQDQQSTGDPSSDESKTQEEKYQQNINEFIKALEDIHEKEFNYDFLSTYNKKPRTVILKDVEETQFTQSEKDMADRLTNMLDISFDPTEDTVKNLRLGKLDITKIAEVPAGNIAIYKQTVENQTTKPFSVAILCDESGSMEGISPEDGITTKLKKQYNTIKSLYLSFSDILPPEKIFIYGHSGHMSPELYIYHDPYNQNFSKTIDRMIGFHNESLNYNYDGPIIEEIHKNIRAVTSDRIIFIVLSDGLPNGAGNYGYRNPPDIINMKQIIEKCKRDDFVTVGVGILEHRVKDLYQYGTVINNLSEMPKKVSHIINHVVKTEFQ